MKLTTAIKRATKATGVEPQIFKGSFEFRLNNYILTIFQNGRIEDDLVAVIETKLKGQEDDTMTDYFPGVFHSSLKKALKYMEA